MQFPNSPMTPPNSTPPIGRPPGSSHGSYRVFTVISLLSLVISIAACTIAAVMLMKMNQQHQSPTAAAATTSAPSSSSSPGINETPQAAKKALCEGALVDAVSAVSKKSTGTPETVLATWSAVYQGISLHPNAPENIRTSYRQYADAVLSGDQAAQARYSAEFNGLCRQ